MDVISARRTGTGRARVLERFENSFLIANWKSFKLEKSFEVEKKEFIFPSIDLMLILRAKFEIPISRFLLRLNCLQFASRISLIVI